MSSGISLGGIRAVVVGLAREGSAITRFLAEQGAQVIVTDVQPAQKLADRIAALQDLPVTFQLGGHPNNLLDPDQTDMLVISPGVPLTIPFLQQARERGLPLTTESRLFCQLCPAPIVGISGSSGKTTTTTLVGQIWQTAGYIAHVGGNIGQPLITALNQIEPQDRVVMELSSFQLEYFHASLNQEASIPAQLRPLFQGWSPKLGALLNITPNHLDRHKTMGAYTQAKRALVQYMGSGQTAVMGLDNPVTREIGSQLAAPVKWFSLQHRVKAGACLIDGQITLVEDGRAIPVCPVEAIKLRGEHNCYNVLAACAIAHAAGAAPEAMAEVVTTFSGVSHRLEVVARQNGVTYINDSIATSPERLIAALKAFSEPIILLAGGKDKDLPWDEAAQLILERVKYLVLFGHAQDLIMKVVTQERKSTDTLQIHSCHTLEEAVVRAKNLAQPGDMVLLSPGCTSYDAYPDFAARGEHFRELVNN